MPLFRCEKCGCVENTALGFYWSRNVPGLWPIEFVGKALCSEHGPSVSVSGKPTKYGKWHGHFEQRSAIGMLLDNEGFLYSQEEVDNGQLPPHCKIMGKIGE